VPTINNKPLDLYLLRKEVRKLGGYYVVILSASCASISA
jgi:histone demethylase JARID1